MSLIVVLVLGLVQGLTEFFPISSSAHLKLVKLLFNTPDVPLIIDLACHLGTVGALIWFFKTEIFRLFRRDHKGLLLLFVAMLPLVPCYFLLKSAREYASKPEFLGLFLMVTGGILLLGQKIRFKNRKGLLRDILLIGTMQSAALIPGISRSASTISCAQALGWTPKKAVRFSFLLAIPTIMAGNLFEAHKIWNGGQLSTLLNLECLIAFLVSFFVGMLVIRFAINWLEKGKLKLFAWYCLGLGLVANLYLYLR